MSMQQEDDDSFCFHLMAKHALTQQGMHSVSLMVHVGYLAKNITSSFASRIMELKLSSTSCVSSKICVLVTLEKQNSLTEFTLDKSEKAGSEEEHFELGLLKVKDLYIQIYHIVIHVVFSKTYPLRFFVYDVG
uniref:Uncharacterized protein n=1 Tax=Arundo donax TaxID=35708 RepID=A0A0A9EBG7_ARUDO